MEENGKFSLFFEFKNVIGLGSFGLVLRAEQQIEKKFYAIKLISIKDTQDLSKKLREVKIWSEMNDDRIVKLHSYWTENIDDSIINQSDILRNSNEVKEVILNSNPCSILNIQMDLCMFSLNDFLKLMETSDYLKFKKRELWPPLGYFVGCEIMVELIEGLNYIHSKKIIHRDIKPANILIKERSGSKYVCIGDFGLSIEHLTDGMSHSSLRGSIPYMAPELMNSTQYDYPADVYSISCIAQHVFNFNYYLHHIGNYDNFENEKYRKMMDIFDQTGNPIPSERPNCNELLEHKKEWIFNLDEINKLFNDNIWIKDVNLTEKEFISYFLKSKLNFYLKFI